MPNAKHPADASIVNPTAKKSKVDSDLPKRFPWAADGSAKVWELISELSEPANFGVLFGEKEVGDVSNQLLSALAWI
jgi:hypothetical protein